jgi:ribosome modulation factor
MTIDFLYRETPRERGKAAYVAGAPKEANPYSTGSPDWLAWLEGWIWASVHAPRPTRKSR